MERYHSLVRYVMVLVLLFCMNGVAVGQDVRRSLFSEAEEAAAAATRDHADILAPKSFGKAMEYYMAAETDFQKGKKLGKIKEKLDEAVQYFQKSVEVASLSKVTFTDTIQARNDAQKARSHEFSPDLWKKGEAKFMKAGTQLEKGGVAAAQENGDEALVLYRESELDAIQKRMLSPTQALIKEAEEAKAEEFAPKTLQSAKAFLVEAREAVIRDRYDTESVSDLTRRADYDARHALYLSNQFRQIKGNAMTLEDFALDFEGILARIAMPAAIVAEFDNGVHKTSVEIIEYIENSQKSLSDQTQKVEGLEEQISLLEGDIARLQENLGVARTDQLALEGQVEAQAIKRKKFEQVNTMFTKEQAQVFREGDNIYIRMVGLGFDVGQAVLKPENFGLLSKALEAIEIYPDSRIIVEGHTDSQGSDKSNLKLSRERAEAVRKYIAANMNMDSARITSEGYGKAHPIASNDTPEGRAMNRRIDLVIMSSADPVVSTGQPST